MLRAGKVIVCVVIVAMADGLIGPAVRAGEHPDLPSSRGVKPELYATGFEFAEGPALDRDGNLYVVNYRNNGTIGRIAPDGAAKVFCDLRALAPLAGRKPQANGLKVDRQGRLVASDAGGGVINVIELPSGKILRQYDAGGTLSTNCHFHGDYLYTTVASKEAVFRLKLGVPGFDYNP
jgi:sugar lactone lactonase YvrE